MFSVPIEVRVIPFDTGVGPDVSIKKSRTFPR